MHLQSKSLALVSVACWHVAVFAQPMPANGGGAGQDRGVAARTGAGVATADAGVPVPTLTDQLDAAAGKPVPATGAPPPAAAAAESGSRFFQSLNPDISVILTGAAGYGQRAPLFLAGDDPDLKGGTSDHSAGITLQELEVAFQ